LSQESLPGPVVSRNILSDNKTVCGGNNDTLEPYITQEPITNEQTASEYRPETTLEWYQRFSNNIPHPIEDGHSSDSVYDRLLEEPSRTIGKRFSSRLDSVKIYRWSI